MAVYQKFEDLPVWKLAKDLALRLYEITKDQKFRRDYSLVDQIRRASFPISSNIAVGSGCPHPEPKMHKGTPLQRERLNPLVMLSQALHHLVRGDAKHPRVWRNFQLAF